MDAEQSEAAGAAGSTPSAEVVGNAFVQQYYHILHRSPEYVYRFYQQSSKLGRPDAQGEMIFVHGMQAINEKILSLNCGEFTAEVKTVDSQESLDGGVIVLVAGNLTGKDNVKKSFAQSFFLATQDKGYFVLNDIFRYVDDNNEHQGTHGLANGTAAPLAPEQDVPAEQEQMEHPVPPTKEYENTNRKEEYLPLENNDRSVVEEEIAVAQVINEVPTNHVAAVAEQSSSSNQEEAPRKSYASIVKVMKENVSQPSAPIPVPSRPAPVNPEKKVVTTPAPALATETASGSTVAEVNISQDVEADGRSIYIKNLPLNATPAQLEEVFKRFGPIKPGGVQVRSHKQQGFCFGFVEFEVVSAVQSAIQASPIMIGGRQAFVEGKRPTGSRVIRGRYFPGRGGGFRNDWNRGRGNYGGWRGYGNRADFSGRGNGRVVSAGRGTESGYQRVEQAGSGGARVGHPGSASGNPHLRNASQREPTPA